MTRQFTSKLLAAGGRSIFVTSFIFLVFLGETHLAPVLIGAMAVSILLMGQKEEKQQSVDLLTVIWILFLGLQLISTFFSHNRPLSFATLALSGLVFVVFERFRFIREKKFEKIFLQTVILTGGVLCVIAGILYFLPQYSSLLPGMNLLHASYGHNHLAAYLLLILPFTWWLVLQKNSEKMTLWSRVLLLVPVFFSLAVVSSYGRMAVLIVFVQTGLLLFYFKKSLLPTSVKRWTTVVTTGVLLVLGAAMILKIFLSIAPSINNQFVCPFYEVKLKLCKPLNKELRGQYWNQAVSSIKEYPVWGYGPGTFSLISRKYRAVPSVVSGYAHNAWLQIGSESGLVALVAFLTLWVVILRKVWLKVRSTVGFSREKALFIGVGSMLVNVWVDFDWNFSSLYLLTFFFVAIILASSKPEKRSQLFGFSKYLERIFLLIQLLIMVALILWATLFLITEHLIKNGRVSHAFDFFPYFYSHKDFYTKKRVLSDVQIERLLNIYPAQNEVLMAVKGTDLSDRAVLTLALQTSPWDVILQIAQGNIDPVTSYDVVSPELLSSLVVTAKQNGYIMQYDQYVHIARFLVLAGDEYWKNDLFEKATQNYLHAYQIHDWALDKQGPIFLTQELSTQLNEVTNALAQLTVVDAEKWGRHRGSLAQVWLQVIKRSLDNQTIIPAEKWVAYLIAVDPWGRDPNWRKVSAMYAQRYDEAQQKKEFSFQKELLIEWYQIWKQYEQWQDQVHYQYRELLAEKLIQLSTQVEETEKSVFVQMAADVMN